MNKPSYRYYLGNGLVLGMWVFAFSYWRFLHPNYPSAAFVLAGTFAVAFLMGRFVGHFWDRNGRCINKTFGDDDGVVLVIGLTVLSVNVVWDFLLGPAFENHPLKIWVKAGLWLTFGSLAYFGIREWAKLKKRKQTPSEDSHTSAEI